MKIKTAFEVWEMVPTEDKYNIAHKLQWVHIDDVENILKQAGIPVVNLNKQ